VRGRRIQRGKGETETRFSTPVSLVAHYFDGGHDACSRFVVRVMFCSDYVFENNLMQQHI